MLTRFCLCFLAAATSCWLAGCGSDDQPDASSHNTAAKTAHHQKKSDDDDDHDMSKPPHVGMSKAQVRAAYGDPDARDVTDSGEEWSYRLNLGDAIAAGMNPFDFGQHSRVRMGQITFGSDGRVKRFHWDAGDSNE